ncbi:hypothetical protein, partial [Cetobacterium sp.]|uniref:hypothetical protein n=2 Tax=Cetobacterium sp. TaxID=2071632 RepID=UPI002FC98C04
MASVMDKIKAKTAELKIQQNEMKAELEIPYISQMDYNEFGIVENELKSQLINCEKKVVYHANQMSKNVMELSKVFSEAQKILSNHAGGTFKKWFEELGFKKDFVYMCLKRNDLFLEVADDKVFQIPERAIKTISKIKDKIDLEEVKEIIYSDKPIERAKEKENWLSGNPTTEIEEIEVIENNSDKIRELEKKLSEYYRKIKDIEFELSILKNME